MTFTIQGSSVAIGLSEVERLDHGFIRLGGRLRLIKSLLDGDDELLYSAVEFQNTMTRIRNSGKRVQNSPPDQDHLGGTATPRPAQMYKSSAPDHEESRNLTSATRNHENVPELTGSDG